MSDNKRYYWLKLKEDFFEDDTIQWLEEQENGKEYTLFYLKLCLKSLNLDGRIVRIVGEKLIPFDKKALAKVTNTDIDTVTIAMNLFVQIGLIELLDTGEIYMKQINEMVGSETKGATRKRKYRKSLEQEDNVPKLSQACDKEVPQSIESRDKSIENRDKSEDDNRTEKKDFKDSVDDNLNPLWFYENNNFGRLSPFLRDQIEAMIGDFIKDGSTEKESNELIIKALEVAIINNVRTWAYAERILINWNNMRYKNIADVDAAEKKYQANKKNKGNNKYGKNSTKKENIPDWVAEQEKERAEHEANRTNNKQEASSTPFDIEKIMEEARQKNDALLKKRQEGK